ncbi:LysR family transcriptional regulator [Rhizobium halophytocola]|uniref:DNA-binding transcriptional LysR family regulator n=1 Tax=Rhizobium halophytocola TaxID=735519 RepID=A0ABS4DUH6_9HYPH|nr:LysR family transcriptional regulator [Rhizobium halophytocola]MBP1849346.1 DNA-binding transcriptional LysR family regulator [Rhizobium halophytocola]
MDKLDAMRMFVRVVENGSFSQTARDVNVSQPTISKQLAALELRLGTQLLARSSRALAVTSAGQEYYETAVRILADIDAAEEKIRDGQSSPSGLVRVTLSPAFGTTLSAFRSGSGNAELSSCEILKNRIIHIGDVEPQETPLAARAFDLEH